MLQRKWYVRRRPGRANRRYGDLVKLAAELSGRAPSTVYAVLAGRLRSEAVERAIEQVFAETAQPGRGAA